MNNKLIFIILFVFITTVYAEDKTSNIKAEYCLYEDTSLPEGSIIPSRWQLKISNFFENLDKIKLKIDELHCNFVIKNMYVITNNGKIKLWVSSPIYTEGDKKNNLISIFSFINPQQHYDLFYDGDKKYFYRLTTIVDKKKLVEWVMARYCNEKEDSIRGNYYINIKGKCSEEDLLWNSKYDIHKIPSPMEIE